MPISLQQQRSTTLARGEPAERRLPVGAPAACPSPPLAPHDFVMQLATHRVGDPAFRARWKALVAAGDSAQKMLQSPEFFTCLQRTAGRGERIEVLSVRRLSDPSIIAVLPVRVGRRTLPVKLGPVTLASLEVDVVTVLGGVPAGYGSATMSEYIVAQLLDQFPASRAVFLPALPRDGHWYEDIRAFAGRGRIGMAAAGGWHEGQTMVLLPTLMCESGRVPAGQRDAAACGTRTSNGQAGAFQMQRIETVAQVPQLTEAMTRLASRAELATLPGELSLACLASQGLLHSCVLTENGRAVAAIFGTRYGDALQVHHVLAGKGKQARSLGTSAMRFLVQDAIEHGAFAAIDVGHAWADDGFLSLRATQSSVPVLLFDRMKGGSALLISYTALLRGTEATGEMMDMAGRKMRAALRVAFG